METPRSVTAQETNKKETIEIKTEKNEERRESPAIQNRSQTTIYPAISIVFINHGFR